MVYLLVPLTPGRSGTLGRVSNVLQSTTPSLPSLSIVQVGQWRSITSNRFVLSMVKVHHLQLKCYPLYSIILNS